METRKLQVVGGTTLSVSVPKSWAESIGAKPGDPLSVEALPDGTLRIRAARAPEARATAVRRLDAQRLTPSQLERRLLALYLAGFDRIELQGAGDARLLGHVEAFSRRLNGLEIVELADGRLTLQDMVDASGFDLLRAFSRGYGVASGIHRSVLSGLAAGDAARFADTSTHLGDIERLALVAQKQTRARLREGGLAAVDAHTIAAAIGIVERVGELGFLASQLAPGVLAAAVDPRIRSSLVEAGSLALAASDEGARAFAKADLAAADGAVAATAAYEMRLPAISRFVAGVAVGCSACSSCLPALSFLDRTRALAQRATELADLAVSRALSPTA